MIDSFKVHKLTVTIHHDEDPESPREWSNLGTMICTHRRYELGDETYHDGDSWREAIAARFDMPERCFDNEERFGEELSKRAIWLPLNLYDHSGISMSTTRGYPFNCPWDSGQVGIIAVSLEDVRDEYSWKRITQERRRRILDYLRQEVATYDEYLTGQVYGYTVENEEGETVDSCWGFFGLDYCKESASEAAEAEWASTWHQLELAV